MTGPTCLPTCSVLYPLCGACNYETDHDGDTYYCWRCGLDYGRGEDGETATYRDESAEPCGMPCTGSLGSVRFDCGICQLPSGHTSVHWAGYRRLPEEVPRRARRGLRGGR